MNNKLLLDNLRSIPDWPIKGVNFRDVTTLFKSPEALKEINDEMYELYKDKGITKIVGIESRGFVMSSALAIRLGAGVVLCRNPENSPAKPYRRVMLKNMESTLSKSIKTPSMKTMLFCSTTTCSQLAEP